MNEARFGKEFFIKLTSKVLNKNPCLLKETGMHYKIKLMFIFIKTVSPRVYIKIL